MATRTTAPGGCDEQTHCGNGGPCSFDPPVPRAVVDERTGLTNRLKALLKQYFPQALGLCGDELVVRMKHIEVGKSPIKKDDKKN